MKYYRADLLRVGKDHIGISPRVGEALAIRDKSLSALLSRVCKAIVERQQRRSRMSRGTVKWFNSQKGYGFIQPQGGGKDVFVHISAVEKTGFSSLNEGQVVEYGEVANKGKTSAENLKVQRGSS
jgi:CspA family cold shock protein